MEVYYKIFNLPRPNLIFYLNISLYFDRGKWLTENNLSEQPRGIKQVDWGW
jgi:hypothetical protein